MVEEWNISWWNSRTDHKGTLEHVMLEQWNRDGGTREQKWWNSRTEMVEQLNNHGGTAEHLMLEQ